MSSCVFLNVGGMALQSQKRLKPKFLTFFNKIFSRLGLNLKLKINFVKLQYKPIQFIAKGNEFFFLRKL